MDTQTRDFIHFQLDGELMQVRGVSPTTSLLNYLREHLGRTGSKEGCAEGDCGACTVVVADLHQGQIRYRAVNACIQFLPSLDGKILYTVESLKSGDSLHPVQQAMVDCHASQCGFCTPGFVMSLFALYKNEATPSRAELSRALSGNLCRCTGYRPILDAGLKMGEYAQALAPEQLNAVSAPGGNDSGQAGLLAALQEMQAETRALEMVYQGQRFLAPRTIPELTACLEGCPDACILAGGTDVGLWVTKQHRDLPTLVYLGQVAELNAVTVNQEQIEIGAAVSLEDAYSALLQYYPQLQELHERFASLPIRNAGTLVGNVANGSPIGDSMPALISLGASVLLRKGKQVRELAMEQFYLGYQQKDLQPGEFVQAVRIPLPEVGLHFRSWKISKRFEQDISAVCAAFALHLDDAGRVAAIRIAYGGMAAIPKRAKQCETALLGQPWAEACVRQAMQALAQDFQPLTDMRASADYRRTVAANLLLRFWLQSSGSAAEAECSVLAEGSL